VHKHAICRNARSSGQRRRNIGSIYTLPTVCRGTWVGCVGLDGTGALPTTVPNLVHGIPIDADRLRCGQRGGDARYTGNSKVYSSSTCSTCGLVPQSTVQYSRSVTGFPVVGRSSTHSSSRSQTTPHAQWILPSVSCWQTTAVSPLFAFLPCLCPFPVLGPPKPLCQIELTHPSLLCSSSLPPSHHPQPSSSLSSAPLRSHLPFFAILGCFACLLVCTCIRRRDSS
jgi:hypothetical protein